MKLIDFGIILSSITFLVSYRNISRLKIKLIDYLVMFLIITIMGFLDRIYSIPITLLGTIIIVFLYQSIFLRENVFKSFIISMLGIIIFCFCDCVVGLFFIKVLKISYQAIKNDVLVMVAIQSLTLSLVYLISKFLGKAINRNPNVLKLKKYSKKFVLVLCINLSTAFANMYMFLLSSKKMGFEDSAVSIVSLISVIYFLSSFVAIAFYGMYIKKDTELLQKTAESKQLGEYTDMIEYLYTDMRKFKHDHVNILSTLNGYIELDEVEELKEYIVKKLLPMGETLDKDDIRLGSLQNLRNIPLKGLLSSKLLQAQNRKMDVLVDITEEIDINEKSMEIMDLCRSVGVFIDNALEASEKSDEKVVRIALVKRGKSIIILVINSLAENIPPIHKMFKKGFSTKGENRGIGLANVSNIIRKYNNITLDTYIEDELFTQEMTINQIH